MSSTVQIILSLLTLLFLSIITHLAAPKIRVPYSVLLVGVGFLLIPLSKVPAFSYITSFQLTSEILFFIFLPILIFESAYNMNIRRIGENFGAISALAIIGLLVSAFFIAFAGYWGLKAVGVDTPFIVVLLFGALISATDPVAILALFKDFGAPRRLALIFEGESLFNDATSLALFLIVLESVSAGFHGAASALQGIFIFISMLFGGTVFGFMMGWFFSKLLQYARHEHLQITLTMLAAHTTFLLAEFISHSLTLMGKPIHVSSILATVITSLVISSYGRFKIMPQVQTYMVRFWGYAAFVANSLVFILLGLLFTTLSVSLLDILPALAVIILVVMVARALSVYPVIGLLNTLHIEQPIPRSWQHLMAWGSLRGALAVTMVLIIPDTLSHPEWKQAYSIKEFILALTIGCIYFTLFIKATTMNGAIRRFRINELQGLEPMEYLEGKLYVYAQTLLRLASLYDQPHVDKDALQALQVKYTGLYQAAYSELSRNTHDFAAIFARVLRIHAIGIEKRTLKELYASEELTESAYHRVLGMLEVQLGMLEQGLSCTVDFKAMRGKRHWMRLRQYLGMPTDRLIDPAEKYLYYRALTISSQMVITLLSQLAVHPGLRVFEADAIFSKVLEQYQEYEKQSVDKAAVLLNKFPALETRQLQILEQELFQSQTLSLEELESSEVITSAVKSVLYGELRQQCKPGS
ncbi:MAG: sodium:proton antiporter [Sulfurimicrobium sp.]|nr:sodium:proton antiporter [Sulfurimicrobium sp.]MDP3688698.1 sodium:proton antiporter [Sulfurimicrobium sp.]